MKTSRFVFVTILGFILLASFYSCKHKVETVVINYPLVGQWKGTTIQNQPITISVGHVDTGFYITSYDFYVKSDSVPNPDSVLHLTRSSANGMGPVIKNNFSVPIAHVTADFEYVKGTFDPATLTLAGNIMVIFNTPPDTVRETYTASKQK
jgi:hypothetical protein